MADQNYEIRLKVTTDDSSLDRLEGRISNIQSRGIRSASRDGVSRSYRWIPQNSLPLWEKRSRRLGSNRYLSNEGFLSNVNEAYYRYGIFRRNFLGNTTSLHGWLTNISRFGGVISQVGRIAGAAVPALGAFGTVLGGVTTAIAAFKGLQWAKSGISLWAGNRLLNNPNISQGAGNIMQMGMASKALGPSYREAFENATDIAARYGFSRTGVLGTISMLTGLDIGGRKLTSADASRIAAQAGKVAHVSSAPYERVAINMQQLLGQQTSSARDLRELITAAPILATIAQRSMERKGINQGIFDYLKDKQALLEVLNEFDSWVESNPFLTSKGRVALYKENFYNSIASTNPAIWQRIEAGMKAFYEALGERVPMLLDSLTKNINPEAIREAVGVATSALDLILRFITNAGNILGKVFGSVGETLNYTGSFLTSWGVGLSKWIQRGSPKVSYPIAEYDPKADSIIYSSHVERFGPSYKWQKRSTASIESALAQARSRAMEKAGISPADTSLYKNRLRPLFNSEGSILPYRFELPESSSDNPLRNAMSGASAANDAATNELSAVSKGARSLVINFNREIVNMPVNIDKVNDGADLANQIGSQLYDVIVRGLNISLNNATGAI